MVKLLVAMFVASVFSLPAVAGGYGSAGCGLGSLVFGSSKGFVQVLASTTNGTSGSQTFGITSGTSNCGGGGKSAIAFIEANKTSLSNDIARGQGETLKALAEIYGLKNVDGAGKALKASYKEIFKTSDATNIEANIRSTLKNKKLM